METYILSIQLFSTQFQQNWEAQKTRSLKPPRILGPSSQQLHRQQVQNPFQTVETPAQSFTGHHHQQQQNYLNKIERSREIADEKSIENVANKQYNSANAFRLADDLRQNKNENNNLEKSAQV